MNPTMDIGEHVRARLTAIVTDGTRDPGTTRALLSCMESMEEAIEAMCPIAIGSDKENIAIAYGPDARTKDGMTFLFATEKDSMWGVVTGWIEGMPKPPKDLTTEMLWAMIVRAVTEGRLELAIGFLQVRLGRENIEKINKACAEIRQENLTPVIVSLAWADKEKSCGLTMVERLPASLGDQLRSAGIKAPPGAH